MYSVLGFLAMRPIAHLPDLGIGLGKLVNG